MNEVQRRPGAVKLMREPGVGPVGLRKLRELARAYLTLTRDLTRVMSRLKALHRSWAIPCAGTHVYSPAYRSEWLAKITEIGVRCRAGFNLNREIRRDWYCLLCLRLLFSFQLISLF